MNKKRKVISTVINDPVVGKHAARLIQGLKEGYEIQSREKYE